MGNLPSTDKGHILLIYPPSPCHFGAGDFQGEGVDFNQIFPPLGLLYIASALVDAGYDITVADFTLEPYSLLRIQEFTVNQDIIGISVIKSSRAFAFKIIEDIRTYNQNAYIILGGPEITIDPELPDTADVVVMGEAESRIAEIVNALLLNWTLAKING